jgi:6-phosphogluconolactonase
LGPAEAAGIYVVEISDFFGLKPGEIPVFDVIHRGMGPDAHTASLFPGDPLIHDCSGIATNVWVEKFKMDRVTLLPAVLLAARHTVLQVSGPDKAEAVKEVLDGPEDWMKYPCQIASRDSNATWFLDDASAAKL